MQVYQMRQKTKKPSPPGLDSLDPKKAKQNLTRER